MEYREYLTQMDKSAFEVTDMKAAHSDDTAYWLSKPPEERFIALEIPRRRLFGHDAIAGRLQRFLEVAELPRR